MLRELATFSNPEFYQAQKMRLPTYDKPRIIDCSKDFPSHIGLPRGCLEKMFKVFANFHIQVEFQDKRKGTLF